MITKTAAVYLLKEAGWLDDVVYNVNDIIGNNDFIDKAKHYGSKVIDAGSNALKSGGKMLSDAAGRVSDMVGQAANTGIAHAKRFANDVGRGYSDLYKYVTKDPQFMRSLKAPEAMSELWHRANKSVGRRLAAKAHENSANEAADFAKTLEPVANAYEKGKATLGRFGKWLFNGSSSKAQPRVSYRDTGDTWV